MRLIDADVANRWMERNGAYIDTEILKAIPTVDAVEIVRCKDCVHWDDDPDTYGSDYGPKGKCMKSFETMCADDFCSYGERKDGDTDGS